MGVATEIIGSGLHASKSVLAPVIGLAAAGGTARTAFKAYTRVPEGHMGIRTRSLKARRAGGELYGVVGSGGAWMWPYVGGIVLIDMRKRQSEVATQADNEGQQLQVNSSVIWRVHNDSEHMYRAHYNVSEGLTLEHSVVATCVGGLRRIAEARSRDTLRDKDAMNTYIQLECANDLLNNYGVVVDEFIMREATPTPAEITFQGQKLNADAITSLGSLSSIPTTILFPIQPDGLGLRAVES